MKTNLKDETMFSIGSTLRQLRMKKGYKSAELFSYENDLNRTAYWRWENGENITMKNFLRLCKIHNVTPKTIFEIIESKKYHSHESKILVNEPGSVLLKDKKKKSVSKKL